MAVLIEQGGNDPIVFTFDSAIGSPSSVSVYKNTLVKSTGTVIDDSSAEKLLT